MEARPVTDVRKELQEIGVALGLLTKIPYIAAYLLLKAKLEKFCRQAENNNQSGAEVNKNIINMTNILLLTENNSPDNSLKSYNRYLARKEVLEAELKLARDKEFVEKIADCSHILYTGMDQHHHIVTTCLCCGISSDDINHKGLSEDYMNQFNYLYNSLFPEGGYLTYIVVSKKFATLEEARYYYNQANVSGESNSLETVERMLKLKGYNRR